MDGHFTSGAKSRENLSAGFSARSAVQPQRMARGLKYQITVVEGFCVAKTKVLISCVVTCAFTAQLICAFVFTYEPRREKTGFCVCGNKDTDQLRGNREADQRLCFCYKDRVQCLYFLNPTFQASSHLLWLYTHVGPGKKNPKTGFLTRRLICKKQAF